MCKFVNLETVVVPLHPIPLPGCHCVSASSAQSATVSVRIFSFFRGFISPFRVVSMFTYFMAVLLVLWILCIGQFCQTDWKRCCANCVVFWWPHRFSQKQCSLLWSYRAGCVHLHFATTNANKYSIIYGWASTTQIAHTIHRIRSLGQLSCEHMCWLWMKPNISSAEKMTLFLTI